jgi:hypothetical protein|tara:strand:+ start:331 stop:588 length:258 start_codon:yes stop_codon:yes gene_type:complete
MENLSKYARAILRKLFNKKRIGGKHTEEKNCLRWIKNIPPKLQKEVYREWKSCINQGLIIREMKTGEFHVSLNPRKLMEIYKLIK